MGWESKLNSDLSNFGSDFDKLQDLVYNGINKQYIRQNTDVSVSAVTLPNNNRIYPDGKKMWFQFNNGSDNFGWISMDGIVNNINNCI